MCNSCQMKKKTFEEKADEIKESKRRMQRKI